jgi:hypothetical protein
MFLGCDEINEYSFDKVIYLDYKSLALYYGDEQEIVASPSAGRDAVQWTSEDETVATVSSTGRVKAVGVGETRIFASLGTGRTELPVTVTIPTADVVISRAGKKRVAFDLVISNDRVKTVKITRMDNNESQETDINFQRGTFLVYYTEPTAERYPFRLVCIDKYGNESVPVDRYIQSYGDAFQNTLTKRSINVVTKFGNGYAIGLSATSAEYAYSEVSYKNLNGVDVSKQISGRDPAIYLYDYDGSGFSLITYFFPEPTAADTFYTEKIIHSGGVNYDRSVVITSSASTFIRPGDFDLGGEDSGGEYFGFHDSNTGHDPGSSGISYRRRFGDYLSDAVDIEDDNNGNVGYTNPGEWLMYTVEVRDEGDYEIDWNVSVNGSGAVCHIEVDDVPYPKYDLVSNGGWTDWRYYCERNNAQPPVVHLTQGKHTIMYVWDGPNCNYNGLRITPKL